MPSVQPPSTKELCDTLRAEIKGMCAVIANFRSQILPNRVAHENENRSEVMANLTIAYRSLEDAAMRLGKAIQADQGGESPLGGPNSMR